MFEMDRITESGKKSIINLLEKSLEVEYAFIFNYPRLIHQLVNIERIPQKNVAKNLELLGKVSVQHAGWVMRLIEDFGGKPGVPIEVFDRIIDIPRLFLKQLEREKLAQSLFKQAKSIAEQNQAKGILVKMKTIGAASDMARSRTIRILEQLEIDEERHIKLIQNMILELDLPVQQ